MSEQTLRIRTKTELAELQAYIRLVREAADAQREFKESGKGAGMSWRKPGPGGGEGAGGERGGGGGDKEHEGGRKRQDDKPPWWDRLAGGGVRTAQQAVAMGLGAGAVGFLFQSAHVYLELSRTIAQLNARFREGERDATAWGSAIGYTRAQTAGLIETLGGQTGQVNREDFTRYAGFARRTGTDARLSMSVFGGLSRLTHHTPTDLDLAGIVGRAEKEHMGGGFLEEYLQMLTRGAQMQLGARGATSIAGAQGITGIAPFVFGEGDPRGHGEIGMDFTSRLHGTLTSGTLRTFMMRAMGYGRDPSVSWLDMRERLEAGVTDPENLTTLFEAFQARGLSKGGMARALDTGQLKAHELRALTDALGTREGLAAFKELQAGGTSDATQEYLAGLSPEDRKVFEKLGFAGLGVGDVSMGEHRALQIEDLQMQTGKVTAKALVDLTDTIISLIGTLENVLGLDIGGLLTDLTGAMRDLAALAERGTSAFPDSGVGFAGNKVFSGIWQRAQDIQDPKATPSENWATVGRFYRGLWDEDVRASNPPEWYGALEGGSE